MSTLSELLKDVQELRYRKEFNDIIDWLQHDLCINCFIKWRDYLMSNYEFYYKSETIYKIADSELSKLYDGLKDADGEARAFIQGERYGIIKFVSLIGERTPDFEKTK